MIKETQRIMMHAIWFFPVLLLFALHTEGFWPPGGLHLGPQTLRDDGRTQSGQIFDFPDWYLNKDNRRFSFVRLEFHLRNPGSDRSTLNQNLKSTFDNARRANVGLILRFYYFGVGSWDDDGTCNSGWWDPSVRAIQNDVNAITPTLEQYSNVIVAVQAGFIGTCDGEWHGTNLAPDGNQNNWNWDSVNAKKMIVERLTRSGKLKVMLRYPRDVADLFGGQARSLGIHNDCLMAPNGDEGTFSKGALWAWSENDVNRAREWVRSNIGGPIAGEFCRDIGNVNCDNLVQYIQYNKISYINFEANGISRVVNQCYDRVAGALRKNAGG